MNGRRGESRRGTRTKWLLTIALMLGGGCGEHHQSWSVPVSQGVSLAIEASSNPTLHTIDISAQVTNNGPVSIFTEAGCTACSYPLVAEPISFALVGPSGESLYPNNPFPCGDPCYGPPYLSVIEPGATAGNQVVIDGTAWILGPDICFASPSDCTKVQLPSGRYEVRAVVTYWADANYQDTIPIFPKGPSTTLTKSVFVDWQQATPSN
jgi:hypothetical protein